MTIRSISQSVCSAGAIAAASMAFAGSLYAHQTAGGGPAAQSQVTFSKDVAPILYRSCVVCHRPGSIAPMSLTTYEAARPWARAIKQKVFAREMPPWYIERNVGIQKFKDDRSLTDAEIATISRWIDAGAPRGNPADLPVPPTFAAANEWTMGTPDLTMATPEPVTV